MRIIRMTSVGRDYEYVWPEGPQNFGCFVDYIATGEDGEHNVRIGFGKRETYGRDRIRVVIWIDGHPHAEFLGADDFDKSGEVLSEIKVPGDIGERICRYQDEAVPERYVMFEVEGLPVRVSGSGVHGAWGVVANIGDHKNMVALAGLRRLERTR